MALFLTRVLAADGVLQQLQVTVSPETTASQAAGSARTYTATFKTNAGTNYTGAVGIQLLEATDAGAPIYNDVADFVNISAVSDALVINGGGDTATGTAGADGVVTFTILHAGTAEDTIPLAWIDTDGDGTYETAGNVAPTEPYDLGGETDFTQGPAAEAAAGAIVGPVCETTKSGDVFEGGPCIASGGTNSYFYDSGDTFTVDGAAATLQTFEDALSVNDTIAGTYDPDTADQSTFNLTNAAATLSVSDPAAATTVDAATYAIMGTGAPGATVNIGRDNNNDGDAADAGEGTVATGTVDPDGNWTISTPLQQNTANNFVATQVSPAAGPVDVPTITEAASAGATITASGLGEGGTASVVDPFDTIVIVFSEGLSGVSAGDTVTVTDGPDTGVITNGTNATFTLGTSVEANDTLFVSLTAVIPGNPIGSPTTITAVGGFTDNDGEAINVAGSGAARTFVH
jgi:hypothetical protein